MDYSRRIPSGYRSNINQFDENEWLKRSYDKDPRDQHSVIQKTGNSFDNCTRYDNQERSFYHNQSNSDRLKQYKKDNEILLKKLEKYEEEGGLFSVVNQKAQHTFQRQNPSTFKRERIHERDEKRLYPPSMTSAVDRSDNHQKNAGSEQRHLNRSYSKEYEFQPKRKKDDIQSLGFQGNHKLYDRELDSHLHKPTNHDFDRIMRELNDHAKNQTQNNSDTFGQLNIAILEAAKQRDIEAAERAFSDIKSAGFEPNINSYNALFKAYSKSKFIITALQFFDEMKAQGLQPNLSTYIHLINMCGRNKNLCKAIQLFEELLKAELNPDVATYTSLINACLQSNDSDKAFEVFEIMQMDGMQPNEITYNSLIDAFIHFKKHKLALIIYDEMKKNGIHISETLYRTMEKEY